MIERINSSNSLDNVIINPVSSANRPGRFPSDWEEELNTEIKAAVNAGKMLEAASHAEELKHSMRRDSHAHGILFLKSK